MLLQAGLHAEAAIVRSHHERWDGTGYPDRLRGEAIPLESRIIAVADTFDAMTSDRPYRAAMPRAMALAEIERVAGSQLDPPAAALMRDVAPD
jgi:HD-GYP domain-containing protein (c-di-GMP phosphodiesterase class II)